jgi:hypothetical protein
VFSRRTLDINIFWQAMLCSTADISEISVDSDASVSCPDSGGHKFFRKDCKIPSYISFSFIMALRPLVGPWSLLQFGNLFYTLGRTPWTGNQDVARPLSKHRTTQTQNKRIHRYQSLEWGWNP